MEAVVAWARSGVAGLVSEAVGARVAVGEFELATAVVEGSGSVSVRVGVEVAAVAAATVEHFLAVVEPCVEGWLGKKIWAADLQAADLQAAELVAEIC